jgi:hypothetical protein
VSPESLCGQKRCPQRVFDEAFLSDPRCSVVDMSTLPGSRQHAVLSGLDALDSSLDSIGAANLWSATAVEAMEALTRVLTARARLDAALLAVVREVDGRGVASELGMKGVRGLLQDKHLVDSRPARQLVELATAVDNTAIGAALAAGALSIDHARVISTALHRLPAMTSADERARVEADLIRYAGQLTPEDLTVCANRIKEQLTRAADSDDPDDAPDLDPTEAFRGVRYGVHRSGLATINITCDPHTRSVFDHILDPLARPEEIDGILDERTASQRRADAFTSLVHEHQLGANAPSKTSRAAVTVTIDYETLSGLRSRAGVLDDGTPIGAGTLRTLLCSADVLPTVLGGQSEVLDLGRTRRLHSHYQHRALALRDRGCVFGACRAAPSQCHDHHSVHWADGGPTTLDDAALLCARHHRQLHREGWEVGLAPNGYPRVIPPESIDPTRQPRQHPRFRNEVHRR